MSEIVPSTRPRLESAEVRKIIAHYNVNTAEFKLIIVGIRGYYSKMGVPAENDRAIYDDAMFIVTPEECISFNANTDPSIYRPGMGFAERKGVGTLKAGVYYAWKLDLHKGKYLALCQRLGPMTVIRDGNPPYEQTSNYLGINNHHGGSFGTTSLACQTIYLPQWQGYIDKVVAVLKAAYGDKYKEKIVPYCLIDEKDRRLL